MFALKPDFEEVFKRYEAWWHGEILDRPLVSISFNKPPEEQIPLPPAPADLRTRWLDAVYVAAATCAQIENRVFFADSLPVAFPNLGPEVFSTFYGCPMEYGEHTGWTSPILKTLDEAAIEGLKLDWNCFHFKKLEELTRALLERASGRFIVGYTDLHGGADALAALRDPQELLVDTLECPDIIRKAIDRINPDFLAVYDHFYEILTAAGMPSTTWTTATGKGRYHIPSNDFSCMISEKAFQELFLPGIVEECRHMDRCLYHLDGPQALRHLDALLEIDEIQAIQWVPGAGQDDWKKWIPVYRKIQDRGRSLQLVALPATDIGLLMENLRPEGVWISSMPGIATREDAEWAVRQLSAWTGR